MVPTCYQGCTFVGGHGARMPQAASPFQCWTVTGTSDATISDVLTESERLLKSVLAQQDVKRRWFFLEEA